MKTKRKSKIDAIIFDKVVKALSNSNRRLTIISIPPMWKGDRHSIDVIIGMNQDDDFVDEIHHALNGIQKIGSGFEVGICGGTSCYEDGEYKLLHKLNGGHRNNGRFIK